MSIPEATVGIDAGATLCKIVYHEQTLVTARYSSDDRGAVQEAVRAWAPRRVVATGGGAERLGREIGGVPLQRVEEFRAWARGAPILAARAGIELPPRYLLVSLGTGTSVLAVEEGVPHRVGGTALGGGTLVGLARLLLKIDSFPRLTELARKGDRRRVDLLVGDIYRDGQIPLPRELTAANFGKIESTLPEDLACALMGLLGENVALICIGLARQVQTRSVLYCGSTVSNNPPLQEILSTVSEAAGLVAHFPPDGAFCGAVGAAALAQG